METMPDYIFAYDVSTTTRSKKMLRVMMWVVDHEKKKVRKGKRVASFETPKNAIATSNVG